MSVNLIVVIHFKRQMIRAILFDFIGTTVIENHFNIINNCFEKSFLDNNVSVDINLLRNERGKDKNVIIENILKSQRLPLTLRQSIYSSFKMNVTNNAGSFIENKGLKYILSYLRGRKIKIGLGTGLERDVFERICSHLQWDELVFDYVGISNEVGRSRPYPDMIFDMMKKTGIFDTKEFLKIGDTIADIQEGKNAGVLTAAILSGTQNEVDLLHQNPDFVLTSLFDIKNIFE
jgi:phosphonatase-like hydrolase